jgi:hypothetical protein
MAWDSVPFFVGGGAIHSPEIVRVANYAFASGNEGIVDPDDCKVVPLNVPGGSIRVLPGAVVIINRATGSAQQAYVGRLPVEDVVAIAATGSGSGRTDLVVARVEDPFVPGSPYQEPTDATVGPYIFTRVISNVPASAVTSYTAAAAYLRSLGQTAIPLAGISLPASTGTVTVDLIKPLRKVAQPRKDRVQVVGASPAAPEILMASSFARWITPAVWSIDIPAWATNAIIRLDVLNAIHQTGNVYGTLGLFMDGALLASGPYAEDWVGATKRATPAMAGDVAIPASARGTTKTFDLRGLRAITSGSLTTDAQTRVLLDIEFVERAAA